MYTGGGDVLSTISTMSSNMVVDADRPMTIVAGSTPIGIGDQHTAVLSWGCGGGATMPELPIKGMEGTAIAGPAWGMVRTHLTWVVSQ